MQSYIEIPDTDSLEVSRAKLLDNDKTVMSSSSGSAFPTTNLQIGMQCWRTDQSIMYVLESTGPSVWREIPSQVPVPGNKGGTGNILYAIGDLLQATTTTVLSKLAAVATGNVLLSGGVGAPSFWGKVGLTTHVSGVLPTANGGTNVSNPGAAGNVLTSDGTNWVASMGGAGKHSVFVPAAGMVSRITAGAAYNQGETASNRVAVAGFLFDGTTQEHVQFYTGAPKGWNKGTVVARFMFTPTTSAAATTRWEIAGQARGDGESLENAFGSAVGVDTSHTTANQIEISASSGAMTIAGGPATDDLLVFQVSRAPANAGDTYTADALLLGVWLDFTYTSGTDD